MSLALGVACTREYNERLVRKRWGTTFTGYKKGGKNVSWPFPGTQLNQQPDQQVHILDDEQSRRKGWEKKSRGGRPQSTRVRAERRGSYLGCSHA